MTSQQSENDDIDRDDAILRSVIKAIMDGAPIATWEASARGALGGALLSPVPNAYEEEKRSRLVEHLFGGHQIPVEAFPERAPCREADRLRADLKAFVPFGSAIGLDHA